MARYHIVHPIIRRRENLGLETRESLVPILQGTCLQTRRSSQRPGIPAALDAIQTHLCEILRGDRSILRKKNSGESGDIVNGNPDPETVNLAQRGDPVTD
jgi:hypothetical protein